MNKPLREMNCEPCRVGGKRVTEPEARDMLVRLPGWRVAKENGVDKLLREFRFADFDKAFEFAGRIAELAEAQDHHPAILIEWGKVTIQWWTHKIDGLHLNDFIMAARTDDIFGETTEAGN